MCCGVCAGVGVGLWAQFLRNFSVAATSVTLESLQHREQASQLLLVTNNSGTESPVQGSSGSDGTMPTQEPGTRPLLDVDDFYQSQRES